MKSLTTTVLAVALASCVSNDRPVEAPTPSPEVVEVAPIPVEVEEVAPEVATTTFDVGDLVNVNFPDGTSLPGVVADVGDIEEFVMDEQGTTVTCRSYTIRIIREMTAPTGETVVLTMIVNGVPEAALTER